MLCTSMRSVPIWIGLAVAVLALGVEPAAAQDDEPACHFLCAPEFKVEPNVTFENLFNRARVEVTDDNGNTATVEQARESAFEVVLALGVPTEVPRVGFTLETIFAPDIGADTFRDNGIEFELELNLDWLTDDQTGDLEVDPLLTERIDDIPAWDSLNDD